MGKEKMKKCAYTLTEIMIVLIAIGVLAAIIIPVAVKNLPDENLAKFKKANTQLLSTIDELIASDKYYHNGDLGIRADKTIIDGTHDGDKSYFCNNVAKVMNVKSANCNFADSTITYAIDRSHQGYFCTDWIDVGIIDNQCKIYAKTMHNELVLFNNMLIYETRPAMTMGIREVQASGYAGANPDGTFPTEYYENGVFSVTDKNGYKRCYKTICIDIDGVPDNATEDNCVNECPFGYGIRIDGKILMGTRAQEWLEKDDK